MIILFSMGLASSLSVIAANKASLVLMFAVSVVVSWVELILIGLVVEELGVDSVFISPDFLLFSFKI